MASSYDSIIQQIKKKKPARFYLLAGEEPYYIEKLTKLFETALVSEEDRDFNLTVLYGDSVAQGLPLQDVVSSAMRYPVMADRQVVIVRRAQAVENIEGLETYYSSIPDTTVLVLAYHKKPDKRKSWIKQAENIGVFFESERIKDYRIAEFIKATVASKNLQIDEGTALILEDCLGNDPDKIEGEIDKLHFALESTGGGRVITPELVERLVGASKEYNNFELLRAVLQRDKVRAYRIATRFGDNERTNPIQPTLAVLFNYFSNLMIASYLAQKDESHIMQALGLKARFQVKDYQTGLLNYSPLRVYNIIHFIREADALSKGVGGGAQCPQKEILRELLSRIFN